MFEELLSFHRPGWIKGAEYYAHEVLNLYQLGLLKGPRYPEEWFAGQWERTAVEIIVDLHRTHGEVTSEAFSRALDGAIREAEGTYS